MTKIYNFVIKKSFYNQKNGFIMARKLLLIFVLNIVTLSAVVAQVDGGDRMTKSLVELVGILEQQFDVKIDCRKFSPDTLRVNYALSRIRPYSLEQSLNNITAPLDLKWSKRGDRRYRIEPYEYYRRTLQEGRELLEWLSAKYSDVQSWELRRDELLSQVREMLDMESLRSELVKSPHVQLSEIRYHDGYTTQNYLLETLQGVFVGGTIYAPIEVSNLKPLIISPAGHWPEGRLRSDQQYRMATFARMGAVAVDLDIVGWGAHSATVGFEHNDVRSMRLQLLWSMVVTDWILGERGDIDMERIGATGGSGGATHTLLLAIMDSRFRVLAPVVHLVSHFDGGCPCESGIPITLAAGGSCTTELLAAVAAPRPLLVVSDGGDWTASYPDLEYPYLRRIWGFYGKESVVENCHLEAERHDYGVNKRMAVYDFFARTLGLDHTLVDESRVEILPSHELEIELNN